VLDRLEDAGWIAGRWEDQHPEPNKPRRRFYHLTPTGVTEARTLLAARRPRALTLPPRLEPGLARPGPGLVLLRWRPTWLPGDLR
jgi:DNA-binding PadR family transcriptional regulator